METYTFNAGYFSFTVVIENHEKKKAIAELDSRKMDWEMKKDKRGWLLTVKGVSPSNLCVTPLRFLLHESLDLIDKSI